MINFKGKKILITGATGGIGHALVKKFVSLEGDAFRDPFWRFFKTTLPAVVLSFGVSRLDPKFNQKRDPLFKTGIYH